VIRHCDGTDRNLTRPSTGLSGYQPCDCGNVFDDVDHSTVFPHGYIPAAEVRQRWMAEMSSLAAPTGPQEEKG
jgi:hypothetical protein